MPALEQFLGSSAGLSPATVTRLTAQWQADHAAFMDRDLSATDYVYVWADGIHLRIRLEEAKAAVLVMMGVRADGTKELIAMADGYRESTEAWAGLLRDCARRGMRAPVLAVGDGALGFWQALTEVFPDAREQRCWVHETANVLDSLPKSAQPAAKLVPNVGDPWQLKSRAPASPSNSSERSPHGPNLIHRRPVWPWNGPRTSPRAARAAT